MVGHIIYIYYDMCITHGVCMIFSYFIFPTHTSTIPTLQGILVFEPRLIHIYKNDTRILY